MSFDRSDDRVSLETPRQSIDNARGMDTTMEQRPAEGISHTVSDNALRERVDSVLQSDIGVSTLLNRLKQSISSAKDFAAFLKERSVLEERHAGGLKKLSQGTAELIRKPDNRQGSFAQNYFEVTRVHERIADHGLAFAIDLHNMSDELQDLASNMERGRKHWKQSGLNAEKRVQDAESAMDKAKNKYDSLADQYDRTRTGEKQGGKFGLKGPKSSQQQEEDLLRKTQAADQDYGQKVQAAQAQRNELLSMLRPQAVKALYDLIAETDAGLSSQMHKFAALNERLLLSNGLCVNPLKSESNGAGQPPRSLREVAQSVNNDRDFQEYVLSFSNKAGTKPSEIKYQKHPALASPRQPQQPQQPQLPSQQNFNSSQPQFGHPGQSNVGLGVGYDQGPRPGQMTGVTPSPYQNREGQQIPGPYNQYDQRQGGLHQIPSSQYGNAPQLPPIDSNSGGLGNSYRSDSNQRPDMVSPLGSNDYRSTSMPLGHNKPAAPMPGPNNELRPANGPLNQNRSTSQPGFQGQNNYPPSGPTGQGNQQSHMPLLSGAALAGQRNDSYGGGAPPPNANSNVRPNDVPLPSSQIRDMRPSDNPAMQNVTQNNSYRSDGRGPPPGQSGGFGPEQRGQQIPMNNNYRGDSLGPTGANIGPEPRAQQQAPSNNYRGDSLGSTGANIGPEPRAQQQAPSNNYRGDSLGPTGANIGPEPRAQQQAPSNNYRGDSLGPTGANIGPEPRAQQQAPNKNYSQDSRGPPVGQNGNYQPQRQHTGPSSSLNSFANAPTAASQPRRADLHRPTLPPNNPVFGVSLDDLFRRDGTAVPTIVYQCIQAVDLFGLDTEGVYRTSGSAPHIMEMKALFDNDSNQVDFRSPAAFHNDIASVTTLLKHFLRDLPDPLLTSAQYNSFIQAAKLDDDIVRRDSLHAIINSLPDPNYATLRVLTLHLSRVAEHSERNRMTPSNIAICFGPTLMGGSGGGGASGATGGDIRDAGWQARVVETILANCMQIFDDDE